MLVKTLTDPHSLQCDGFLQWSDVSRAENNLKLEQVAAADPHREADLFRLPVRKQSKRSFCRCEETLNS